MDNLQRIAFPLTVGAAVLTIWVAFRKQPLPTGSPAVALQSDGAAVPQSPQATQPEYIDPEIFAGSGVGTDPSYNNAAMASPIAQAPINVDINLPIMFNGSGVQGTPAYQTPNGDGFLPIDYTSQLPPWSNAEMQALAHSIGFTGPKADAASSSGGCGGCSGCGTSTGKCSTAKPEDKLLDGAGECFAPLYSKPKANHASVLDAVLYSVEYQANAFPSFDVQPDFFHVLGDY